VAGVNIGSLATETVTMNNEGEISPFGIVNRGSLFHDAAEACTGQALSSAHLKFDEPGYMTARQALGKAICFVLLARLLMPNTKGKGGFYGIREYNPN